MTNTSATGGILLPNPPSPPLEGQDLYDFLQGWASTIADIDGPLFRPRWQPEPPNPPVKGPDAWCAFGIVARRTDNYPYVRHETTPTGGQDRLLRREELDVLFSFYDSGSGGFADAAAAQLRDGLYVAQNREPLFLAGYGYVGVSDITPAPSLLKETWLYRADLTVTLSRMIERIYPVLDILSEHGTLIANPPATPKTIQQNIDVPKGT